MTTGLAGRVAQWGTILGALSAITQRRATHHTGVALAGRFDLDPDPRVPAHSFFRAGRALDAACRYANVMTDDDASKDARSAAVRLMSIEGPLDLTLHTGRANLFWNASSWGEFTSAMGGGESSMRGFVAKHPHLREAAIDALRRAPRSFHGLVYHQPVTTSFVALDGSRFTARYRLSGEDEGESGVVTGADRDAYWAMARSPGEGRSPRYLRDEILSRVERASTRQVLSIALRQEVISPWDEAHDCSRVWDEQAFPFLRLGTLVLDRALDAEQTRALSFRITNQPPGLALPESDSMDDYVSLVALRARVYPIAQAMRALATRGGEPSKDTTHVARGTLVHDDAEGAPIHHARVELWSAYQDTAHQKLAEGETDLEGRFVLHHRGTTHAHDDLVLKVLEPHASLAGNGQPADRFVERARVPAFLDGPPRAFQFGVCRVPYWEYDAALPIARARAGADGMPQERFDLGVRRRLLARNALRFGLREWHRFLSRHPRIAPSLALIQGHYPESHTARVERSVPGHSRSDAFFGERILDGFSPWIPLRDDDGTFRVSIRFDEVESDGHMDLLSGEAAFRLDHEGRFLPTWIRIDVRDASSTEPHSPTRSLLARADEGARWTAAKRAFRSVSGLAGVIDTHLAHGHLNVEQYAIALFRNVRKNPLRRLLGPHLREVSAINHFGQSAVFGASGIVTNNSPLTMGSALTRLARGVGRCDWSTFRPRAPISPKHRYARVANLFWDLVTQHVDAFFAEHRLAIADEWVEVHRFSRDLVAHAARFEPIDHREQHYCTRELDDPSLPRETIGGVLRAVRPVTRSDTPGEGDLARLAQLARYVIFHATLFHTWENDLQREDGGDVTYATLGVPAGAIDLDDERSLEPSPRQATDQLYYAHGLASRTPGRIVENDRRDVPEPLPTLLAAHRLEMAALGVDVDLIRSRINV